jgi:hypothetical protein
MKTYIASVLLASGVEVRLPFQTDAAPEHLDETARWLFCSNGARLLGVVSVPSLAVDLSYAYKVDAYGNPAA